MNQIKWKLTFWNFCPKIMISKGDGVHPITAIKADNSCREDLKEFFYEFGIKKCDLRSPVRDL